MCCWPEDKFIKRNSHIIVLSDITVQLLFKKKKKCAVIIIRKYIFSASWFVSTIHSKEHFCLIFQGFLNLEVRVTQLLIGLPKLFKRSEIVLLSCLKIVVE